MPHVWDLIITGEYCLKMNGVIIIKTQPNIFFSSLQFNQHDIIYYSAREESIMSPCEYASFLKEGDDFTFKQNLTSQLGLL